MDEGATSPAVDIPENGGSAGVQSPTAEFKEGEEEGKKNSQLGSGNLVAAHARTIQPASEAARIVTDPIDEESSQRQPTLGLPL